MSSTTDGEASGTSPNTGRKCIPLRERDHFRNRGVRGNDSFGAKTLTYGTDIWAGLLATGSHYSPRLPKPSGSVAIAVVVPGYSGGTATDSHRLPYSSVNHSSTDTQVEAESYRAATGCQSRLRDFADVGIAVTALAAA